jgi:tetratricopeptide (TPR) repeat protein
MRSTLAFLMLLCATDLYAQTVDSEVATYVAMVKNGQVDQAKQAVPGLLSKYPNNAGVLYLQGLTSGDGAEAVRIYQSIVDNFPTSSWADDALFKVYQFYHSLGLYRTAEQKLAQLKKNYPSSPYATGATEVDTQQLAEDTIPKPAAQTPQPAAPAGGKYALQVGAYTTEVNAERQKSFFEGLGFPVEIINRVKENRSLFLVLIGTYATPEEAKLQGAEIKRTHNVDSIVTAK